MRWSGGRIRLSFVIPMLLLEVHGARSHALRRVPLLYVDTKDGLIVVGSNGGSAREPAWCNNLSANRWVPWLVGGDRIDRFVIRRGVEKGGGGVRELHRIPATPCFENNPPLLPPQSARKPQR